MASYGNARDAVGRGPTGGGGITPMPKKIRRATSGGNPVSGGAASGNALSYLNGGAGGGAGFNAYAAGNKNYPGGSPNGVPRADPGDGYNERDAKLKAKNAAILARLKAQTNGRFMSQAYLNPAGGNS